MTLTAELLRAELAMLNESYRLAIRHAVDLLDRDGSRAPSTHLGHNLASRAAELSVLAAKIEQTEKILRTLEA